MPATNPSPYPAERFADLTAEARANEASHAAVAYDLDGEVAVALDLAQDRIACGVPLSVVLSEIWRCGYRSGHLDGSCDRPPLTAPAPIEAYVSDQIAKAA